MSLRPQMHKNRSQTDARSPPKNRSGRFDSSDYVFCLLLGGLVLVTRLPALADPALWLDEANSVLIALKSPSGVIEALRNDGNPPLYYLLLLLWQKLWGIGESAVRSLSVVFALVLAVLGYHTAKLWFGNVAARAGALFLALSPLHIYYSRQARMYALIPLLALISVRGLDGILRNQGRNAFLLYTFGLAACMYTHNYGLFLLPVGCLCAVLVKTRRVRSFLLAAGGAVLALCLALPWLPVVIQQSRSGVGDWIPKLFEEEISRLRLSMTEGAAERFIAAHLRALEIMAPGASYPSYIFEMPARAEFGFLPLILLLAALLVAWFLRPQRDPDEDVAKLASQRVGMLTIYLIVPMAIPILYSVIVKPIFLIGRYEIITFPAVVLLVGVGVRNVLLRAPQGNWRTSAACLLLGVLVGLSLSSLLPYFGGKDQPSDYGRAVTRYLAKKGVPGDAVLFCEYARAPVEYALTRDGLVEHFKLYSFPIAAGLHPGWYDVTAFLKQKDALDVEASRLTDEIHLGLRPGGQLWVIRENRFPTLHVGLDQALLKVFGPPSRDASNHDLFLTCYIRHQ